MKHLFFALASLFALSGCLGEPKTSTMQSPMTCLAFRLTPGTDLKQALQQRINEEGIAAATVVSAVGSLTDYQLRFANQDTAGTGSGHFEITSLVGTLSQNGSHLHMTIADEAGRCIGGHLLDGNRIYTTAEIVIGVLPALEFTREPDSLSGYRELVVRKKSKK